MVSQAERKKKKGLTHAQELFEESYHHPCHEL